MTPLRSALVAGGSLFVTGFGALATLSRFYPKPEDVPGLTDYLSATWGDSLLLPTSLAGLVYAYRSLPSVEGDRALVVIGAVGGAAGGVLTQIQWLRDDNPQLNWTLPAAHVFNGAGVYHAVFLTLASSAFGAAWAGALRRWAGAPCLHDRRVTSAIAVAFVTGLGFAGLLAVDNQRTQERSSSAATLAVLGGSVLAGGAGFAAASWLRRRRPGR